ncbi:dynamin family protein [Algicella marina]|uniref:Dynamin N-terminal domain-containing protein n=1 Tax=Algicella marina TaxID=2683284 RepID=A0A6P1T0U3_9RHOB|nr:dynamin family protein [Algicella marina]QHQ35263.1 hypothetical protein GO499_08650 [Algicella marina]
MDDMTHEHFREVPADHYARLKSWSERKPRFALMGEFSAGKSTLLNFLVGRDVVPTKTTATHIPAVWLIHGHGEVGHAIGYDGSVSEVQAPDLLSESLASSALIRMLMPSDALRAFDIIDTPGISDPTMSTNMLPMVSKFCNFVLWCTHATQAWRQSEAAAWKSMPKRMRENSILVVTRADKLKSESERKKVEKRLRRETEGLFREIVFIATPKASAAKGKPGEVSAWHSSGGESFEAALARSVTYVSESRAAQLARYLPAEPKQVSAPVSAVDPDRKPLTEAPAAQLETDRRAISRMWQDAEQEAGKIITFEHLNALIRLFLAKLEAEKVSGSSEVSKMLKSAETAEEFGFDLRRTVRQLREEFEEPSQDPWFDLNPLKPTSRR